MKKFLFRNWITLIFGLAPLIALGVGLTIGIALTSVHAAPAAKASESVPDCVAIGKSGPLVVSRCEDETTGQVIFVNNYGMMVVAP